VVPAPVAPDAGVSAPSLVANAGIGTGPEQLDAVIAALGVSRAQLQAGAPCLDAVVAGVTALEDAPDVNAGTGAALRLDGSVELDAAVMTSRGVFGAVAALRDVRHPARIARAVADTPHRLLTGDAAVRLARSLGEEPFELRTEASGARYQELITQLAAGGAHGVEPGVVSWPRSEGAPAFWQTYLPRSAPRAPPARPADPPGAPVAPAPTVAPVAASEPAVERATTSPPPAAMSALPAPPTASAAAPRAAASSSSAPRPAAPGGDTVALLARCPDGDFVGVVSGGGPWLSLPGRVGDVPVPGGALYVGAKGAVFASGLGEAILDRLLARAAYEELVSSGSAEDALSRALGPAPSGDVSLTILDEHGVTVAPAGASAWAALDPTLRTSAQGAPP
jgi:isoaspartyl peptidase/L-asparaginase-like protein (Ntn-hydrolase superfamily)